MAIEVVADASVVAKWALKDEDHVVEAEWLRQTVKADAARLVVPSFWEYELASILSKAVANGRMQDAKAQTALRELLQIPWLIVPIPDATRSYHEARRFERSLIDCFYLALAEERGCDFWTDDRKLCRALSGSYPFVRWIGDYPAPAPSPAS